MARATAWLGVYRTVSYAGGSDKGISIAQAGSQRAASWIGREYA
jgi:hypothetical protein